MRIAQGSAVSNTGRKRRHNEDAYVYDPPLFAVADGMGGARAGEIASSIAAGALRDANLGPGHDSEGALVGLVQAANRRVHERALSDSTASGMGTTMTVALFRPDGNVVIGHVGDSRAYLLREHSLEQLTEDHSLVAELVRRGELSPEQAEVHPQRSVITRALGTEPEVAVDAFTIAAREGDVFLLCSDGLTTMVDAATIADLVQRHRSDLPAAGRALVKAANERGGDDNITAVLFAVAGDEQATASHPFEDEDTLHPEDEVTLPAIVLAAANALTPEQPPEAPPVLDSDAEPPARASGLRLFAAALTIVVLAALIILLVVKGFAQ